MTILKKNIAANLFGNIWQFFMAIAFIPFYIKFMGVEAYGLIGIFTTIQVMLSLFDMGLSGTLNREVARLSALPDKAQDMRNTVRTLEIIYWCLSIIIGIVIMALSSLIAHHWVNPGQLSTATIRQAILIMGFAISLQMIAGFYAGGLIGLQRQVLLNTVNVGVSTLRGFGAVLLLWLVSPTIQAFFLWQIVISIINTFLLAMSLWRGLPFYEKRPVFEKKILGRIWRFTAGISGITLLGAVLSQLDKIILSRMLSLEMFGYYALASVIAMSLGRLISPMFFAVYPRFTQLVSLNDQEELKRLYHKSCQFMSVLIMPVAIVVALFSYELLVLWTHNSAMAEKSHMIVTILVCGAALNGLMYLPYALQLAHGWTNLCLMKCIIFLIVMVPLTIYTTKHYGAVGAASVWLAINLCDFLFSIPLMHRRLLHNEMWQWYWQDIGLPLAAGLLMAGLGRILMESQISPLMQFTNLIIISIATMAFTAVAVPATRNWLTERGLSLIRI